MNLIGSEHSPVFTLVERRAVGIFVVFCASLAITSGCTTSLTRHEQDTIAQTIADRSRRELGPTISIREVNDYTLTMADTAAAAVRLDHIDWAIEVLNSPIVSATVGLPDHTVQVTTSLLLDVQTDDAVISAIGRAMVISHENQIEKDINRAFRRAQDSAASKAIGEDIKKHTIFSPLTVWYASAGAKEAVQSSDVFFDESIDIRPKDSLIARANDRVQKGLARLGFRPTAFVSALESMRRRGAKSDSRFWPYAAVTPAQLDEARELGRRLTKGKSSNYVASPRLESVQRRLGKSR